MFSNHISTSPRTNTRESAHILLWKGLYTGKTQAQAEVQGTEFFFFPVLVFVLVDFHFHLAYLPYACGCACAFVTCENHKLHITMTCKLLSFTKSMENYCGMWWKFSGAKRMSFSSYPGYLVSLDDFYIMDRLVWFLLKLNDSWRDLLWLGRGWWYPNRGFTEPAATNFSCLIKVPPNLN